MQEHFFLQRGLSVAIYAVIAMLFYQHMIKPGIRVKRTLMVYAVIDTNVFVAALLRNCK